MGADREALERHMTEIDRLVAGLRQPVPRWLAGTARANLEMITGDLAMAEHHASDSLEDGLAAGQPDAFLIFAAQLFTIRLHQGRLNELDQLVANVVASTPLPTLEPFVALFQLETGRAEEARATMELLASAEFSRIPFDPLRACGLAISAWVVAGLEERTWAQELEPQLLPYRGLAVFGGAIWFGPVDHYLAVLSKTLGRLDEADQRFSAAAAVASRMGSPPWLARIQVERADLLERRGDGNDYDKAAMLRAEALATARRVGLTSIETRARRSILENRNSQPEPAQQSDAVERRRT